VIRCGLFSDAELTRIYGLNTAVFIEKEVMREKHISVEFFGFFFSFS